MIDYLRYQRPTQLSFAIAVILYLGNSLELVGVAHPFYRYAFYKFGIW